MRGLWYALGWRTVPLLPRAVGATVFGLAGEKAAGRGGVGVRRLRTNLARVVPEASEAELDELVGDAMRSYARYWHEAFRLPAEDFGSVATKFASDTVGASHVDAALSAGNGAVVALPHSGNWDAVGLWLAQTYGSVTAVVERLEPESAYRRFARFREKLGMQIVPLTGGDRPSDVLVERLKGNGVVALVADRDLTGNGVPVDFFGAKASFPVGPAWLAATTGAALLPLTTWFTDDGWGAHVHPRIRVNAVDEVPSATQRLADVFAGAIAAHPTDWHMLQQVWPDPT